MNQDLMLLPLIAMFFLTFGIGVWMLKLRIKAVKEDGLNPGYFLLNKGAKLPDYLAKVSNHYANLFEFPIFFYAVCVALYAGNKTDTVYLMLAWGFVVMRYLHAYIHTTYNNIKHRRFAFLGSILMLASMWVLLFIEIITA